MADEVHVAQLRAGVDIWNDWRKENPDIRPDLGGADLNDANLRWTDLSGADLRWTHPNEAHLHKANLRGADLLRAELHGAHLDEADLRGADLRRTHLNGVHLRGADRRRANLAQASLINADLADADLTDCTIFGISAWKLNLEGTKQEDLVITDQDEPVITVDDIEVAQFIYLLLHNEKIHKAIDTIGKKGVLLLGRFTGGRIEILKQLRAKLRDLGFVPIVFNFDKPETKDFTETARLLAGLSHFVIADLTDPKSIPLELQALVPDTMIPFVPILENGDGPFSMLGDLQIKHDWVLDLINYSSVDRLIEVLETEIVRPAEVKFNELLERRA